MKNIPEKRLNKINPKPFGVAPIGLANKRTIITIISSGRAKLSALIVKWATIRVTVATKVALHTDGAERRWVRQAVMGVLRWRDLPGTRSSTNGTVRSISTIEVNCKNVRVSRHGDRENRIWRSKSKTMWENCYEYNWIWSFQCWTWMNSWYKNVWLPRTEFSWLNKINICWETHAHLKPPTDVLFFLFRRFVFSMHAPAYSSSTYIAALGMNGNVTSL